MFKTIHHVTNGPAVMYEIDARHALTNFPEEWRECSGGDASTGSQDEENARKSAPRRT